MRSVDYFVTYAFPELDLAEWIASELEAAGRTVRIRTWDMRSGENFVQHMDRAISESRHTLGLLSPAYLTSGFTIAEWTAAYYRAVTGTPRAFIPIRARACEITGLLGPIEYVDLVGTSKVEAQSRLRQMIDDKHDRRPRNPGFPGA